MKNYITIITLLLVSIILFQTIVLVNFTNSVTQDLEISGKASAGYTRLCINRPMVVNTTCPSAFNQSTILENWTVTCDLGLSHDFGFRVWLEPTTIPNGVFANMTQSTGQLVITANQTGVGNHTLELEIRDRSPCPLEQTYFYEFEILDINDPPEHILDFESLTIREGFTTIAYVLDNHFYDPDDDPLNYTYTLTGDFVITINPANSQVRILNPPNQCSDGTLYFTATDPGGLSADSNMIELKANCDSPPDSADTAGGATPPPICEPKWDCERWSECQENGSRYRRCYDINACDINRLQRTFWEDCLYIPPQETETSPEEETTTDEEEEEEVRIETPLPSLIQEGEDYVTYILLALLTASIITAFFIAFRKQIRTLHAKIVWYLTKKQRKEILLEDEDKEYLLKKISDIEGKLKKDKDYQTNTQIMKDVVETYRYYFSKALTIPIEFNREEASQKIDKLIHQNLKLSLNKAVLKIMMYEKNKLRLTFENVKMLLQLLRFYVFATAKITKDDVNFKIVELELQGKGPRRTIILIHNAYAALEFQEIAQAQKNYLKILSIYEELSQKYKARLHPEIFQLYHNINYVLSWSKKR